MSLISASPSCELELERAEHSGPRIVRLPDPPVAGRATRDVVALACPAGGLGRRAPYGVRPGPRALRVRVAHTVAARRLGGGAARPRTATGADGARPRPAAPAGPRATPGPARRAGARSRRRADPDPRGGPRGGGPVGSGGGRRAAPAHGPAGADRAGPARGGQAPHRAVPDRRPSQEPAGQRRRGRAAARPGRGLLGGPRCSAGGPRPRRDPRPRLRPPRPSRGRAAVRAQPSRDGRGALGGADGRPAAVGLPAQPRRLGAALSLGHPLGVAGGVP